MLDVETRRRIDTARDILVGKVPDPKSQVEQITLALMYKFMDDIDVETEEFGGKATFFDGDFAQYSWRRLVGGGLGAFEMSNLYEDGLRRMGENPGIPVLFQQMFKNAYLPFRDPETLRMFLQVIDEFDYDNSERLGDAFEHLLSIMDSQGEAGQFRTPRHIIDFIVEIIDPKKDDIILDPACGSAGFLISAYKYIAKSNEDAETPLTPAERAKLADNVSGYDISPDMVRLSLVNLYLHGFPDPDIFEYDTLTSEGRWNKYANVILANPPFMSPKGGIRPHNRFSVTSKRSEVLFVDYIAEHLTPDGRAGVIVPEGIIFQSQNAHKQLRKMLVEDYLVAVISLPPGVFQPYSGVKTSILILDRSLARRSDTIGFFKVENDGYDLGAQRREIDRNDLPRVKAEVKEYLGLLRGGIYMDGGDEGDVLGEFETGLVVEKDKIGEDGEFNLSGERYRSANERRGTFPYIRIDQICTVNPKKGEINGLDPETKVSFLPMADLTENQMIAQPVQTRNLGDVSASYSYFKESDVLLARVTPCFENGKAGIATGLENGIGFGSSEFHVLRCSDIVLPQWAYFCVTYQDFRQAAILNMTGTGGLQRVPRGFVEEFAVPVPPLEVQREIVSEIEGYQRVIDGARAVVENWRPRIAVDPGWPVVELGKVIDLRFGKRITKRDNEGTLYPVYGGGGASFYTDTYSREDDVVISRFAMSPECVRSVKGKFYLLDSGFTFEIADPYSDGASKSYVSRALIDMQDQIYACSRGHAQRNLDVKAFKTLEIPLPRVDLQQEIVAELDAQQKLVDGNLQLIEVMEGKVREVVGRVWGDNHLAFAQEHH